jgi:murein DD-endopeptidase MepM/ murein hydrolase activator NlpD
VEVSHKWGISLYAHLSEVKVSVGQKIRSGQKIALSGQSGLVTGPHLHLGIRLNQTSLDNGYLGYSDPMEFIRT